MKNLKFIALFLAMVVISGPAFAYDNPTFSTYNEKRNAGGRQSDPVRVIKLVRYASRDTGASLNVSAPIASGDAVKYDIISDDGVTVSWSFANSGDAAFAGIAVTSIPTPDSGSTSALDDLGKRNWGWILIHGPVVANVVAGGTNSHSAGDPFIMSNDAGRITTYGAASGGTTPATVQKHTKGGFFYDAVTAANTTEEVFVRAE